MATAEKHLPPQDYAVVLTLSRREAEVLRRITELVGGVAPARYVVQDIGLALEDAGVERARDRVSRTKNAIYFIYDPPRDADMDEGA